MNNHALLNTPELDVEMADVFRKAINAYIKNAQSVWAQYKKEKKKK
jgi:predicted nucleic-acid-binding protein